MIALLVDVGNSRIKWRIATIDAACSIPGWITERRAVPTTDGGTLVEAFAEDAGVPIDAAWCSNVAGEVVALQVRQAIARRWGNIPVHAVEPRARQCGVVNGYRDPARLGPDRWLAVIGAHLLFPGRTLVVCTFGTATTIDLLVASANPTADDAASFVGGLILPGIDVMRTALSNGTAQLPMAEGRVVDFADNTDDAITSGIAHAQLGAVQRALKNARSGHGAVTCVLSGGGANPMIPLFCSRDAGLDVEFVVAHDLVLSGMAAVAADSA